MQIGPGSRSRGIVRGFHGLRQSRDDTHRHFGAGAVEDRLVQRLADCLAQGVDDFGREVDVVILQNRIADRKITADLVAVDLNIVKAQGQLIQLRAHLCPDCFGDLAHNPLSGGAADPAQVDTPDQLGGLLDLFLQKTQHDLGNRQPDIGQRSLFADAGTHRAEEIMYILPGEKRIPLLQRHAVKFGSAFHVAFRLSFRFMLRGRNPFICSFFLFLHFTLDPLDLRLQSAFFLLMRRFLGFKVFDLLLSRCTVFFRRFSSHFVKCRLQLRFSRSKTRILCPQRFKFGLGLIQSAAQYHHSQCHFYPLPFSLLIIFCCHASNDRFLISESCAFLALTLVST